MITIADMERRALALKQSIETLTVKAIDQTKEQLLEANRDQLYDGKNRLGQDITPGYLDDPYFKTKESAQRYSDWKDTITPNPDRTKGIPNLYIVGTYHKSIKIDVSGLSIVYTATFRGEDIERKYGENIYGLGGERKVRYTQGVLKPVYYSLIKDQIKL